MTIQDIINWVNGELTKVRGAEETLEDALLNLLNLYRKEISCADDFESYGIDKERVVNNIEESIKTLMKALDQYASAHIVGCINTISEYLKNNENLFVLEIKADAEEDNKWYRMRMQERYRREFCAEKMFHIPFDLRGKYNPQNEMFLKN